MVQYQMKSLYSSQTQKKTLPMLLQTTEGLREPIYARYHRRKTDLEDGS